VPNSIPIEEIDCATPYYPEQIELLQNVPRVLFVGRLIKSKRVDVLLDVFKLATKKTSAVLLVCGQGPEYITLQNLVTFDDQLINRVFFLSYQANIWGLMKTCDVFVSLSGYEGCPNAVLEAAVCGLPLLLSDIPGHRELVGDNAWYVQGEPREAANCLIKVLDENERIHAKSISTRRALQCYGPQAIALKLNQYYETIIRQHTETINAN
jgi:glycosyltransferase involved in cell wall biosynthesis